MLLVVHHISEIWVTTSFTNFYNDHISKLRLQGHETKSSQDILTANLLVLISMIVLMILLPISRTSRNVSKSLKTGKFEADLFVVIFCLFWYDLENHTYFCLFSPIVYCKIFQSKKNHGGQDHSCGDVNLSTLSFERKSWPIEKSQRFSTFEHSFFPDLGSIIAIARLC